MRQGNYDTAHASLLSRQTRSRVVVFLQAYEEAQKRLKLAEDDQKNMVSVQGFSLY